jgi:DNA-binding HxlR family transcriptional regulator
MILLDTPTEGGFDDEMRDDRRFRPSPANGICARLGDKWTLEVLWRLSRAPDRQLRFSALRRQIDGITQRMLTLTLRNLERDGFVTRHYFPEVPPRVEYELTEMGAGILRSLEGVNLWIRDNIAHVEKNRRAYDEAG